MRKIKNFLSNSACMIEQRNYIFYDENFISQVGLKIGSTVDVENPISANQKRLIRSLVPNILKNIKDNFNFAQRLNFFEFGRVWIKEKVRDDCERLFNYNSLSGGI